ncbi:unnamed protein product [Moneuplotes crassus]|uniref:Uncharacterized protein n=1 Tax=Euplotes crassus TaxID=5936 RepID=A0AAD1XS02_EUPCR|nr:unnamed protein product [Moneuplotes crassus]
MAFLFGANQNLNSYQVPLPQANVTLVSSGAACKCGFVRHPTWVIPPVAGIYDKNNQENKIGVTDINFNAQISNSIADIELAQTFVNTTENPIECLLKFPLSDEFAVTGVTIKMEDKEIQTDIMPKKKAEEKYDDAIAQGHTAVKVNYNEATPDILNLDIGDLDIGKEISVNIKMSLKCQSFKHGQFTFVFPCNFFPISNKEGSTFGTNFSNFQGKITLDLESQLTNLDVSHEDLAHSTEGDVHILEFPPQNRVFDKDIVISYSFEKIRDLKVKMYGSLKYPDEVVSHFSFIPRISDELDEEEGKLTEEEQKEGSSKFDDPEIASGEYIFLIDRSGSMGCCSRMQIAVTALELFIQSLPQDSKFNIVSFGSSYGFFTPESLEFNDENKMLALDEIKSYTEDMGGTNIYSPLKHILLSKYDCSYPRNVFLLTDGGVCDRENVINLIKENSSHTRVHSFGIGTGADQYLIKESAKAGKGKYHFAEDGDLKLNAKVISSLSEASRPGLTNISIDWGDAQPAIKYQTVETQDGKDEIETLKYATKIDDTYEEESLHLFTILDKQKLFDILLANPEVCVKFRCFNTLSRQNEYCEVPLNCYLNDLELTESPFTLACKHLFLYLKESPSDYSPALNSGGLFGGSRPIPEPQNVPKKIEVTKSLLDVTQEELSIKYKVLCKDTAFFGRIKNLSIRGEEMKTVEIDLTKIESSSNSSGGVLFRGKGGSLFGSASGGGSFGNSGGSAPKGSGGLFGSSAGSSSASTSLFGGAAGNSSSGGGLFGASSKAPNSGGGLFGSNVKSAEGSSSFGGGFGNSQGSTFGSAKASGFESSAPLFPGGQLFGSSNPPASFSGFSGSSGNTATLSTSHAQPEYCKITSLQKADGSFVELPEGTKTIDVCGESNSSDSGLGKAVAIFLEKVQPSVIDHGSLQILWNTLFAIAILKKHHNSTRSEWNLISKKAIRFCKNYISSKSEINQLIDSIMGEV